MSIKNRSFLKDSETLHHAYLIAGSLEENLASLRKDIESLAGILLASSPDYYERILPAFTIDESRELIESQKTTSFAGGERFFVIAAHSFTAEAQNGLLKVLEDSVSGKHFFILAPSAEILLPTLRSRLMHLEGEELSYEDLDSWCQKFLKSSITDRLVMIEKSLKDDDEEGEKSAKHKTADILSQLEKILADRLRREPSSATAKILEEIIRLKGYLNDTAPAPRLILEYIAFIL